jgi:hypothetical protein
VKIRFTPEARQRARAAAVWWRANRPATRYLFDQELAEIQEKVLATPTLGIVYTTVRGMEICRILMRKTGQHFYFSVDKDAGNILVHMIWGARRGRPPKL